ncbi:hypothetical protein VE02_08098 [Pseudogymnoascus sp. 03VT05]|nr:hypothetical protein VE02_08098 [Pseudogymnoascus sp. 03VT05]
MSENPPTPTPLSDNPPPLTPLSDNPPSLTPMSENPPPPSSPPCPSSPTLSTCSWTSSLLLPTPYDISTMPSDHNGLATLLERKSALFNALQELADEKAKIAEERSKLTEEKAQLAQEKEAYEEVQKIDKRHRRSVQAFEARLVGEEIDMKAKKRSSAPSRKYETPEVWELVAGGMAVATVATCIIPVGFMVGTMIRLQFVACRGASVWVLGLFGL